MSSPSDIVVQSRDILATHARSFRWASRFLPADTRTAAAVVYAFCRLVDDLADESADAERAGIELSRLEREVRGESAPRPLVGAFLDVAQQREMDVRSALELVEGVQSDLGEVRMRRDANLLRYCYRVAGTVGLMMCSILGVDDARAHPHAIDLGVAMQLTNICRDVLEDAERGRVYLPTSRLARVGVTPDDIVAGTADREAVASVVRDLLQLADSYYASADAGMRYIPQRSRFAIVVASRLYRGIGVKLVRRKNGDALAGRTWVRWPGKIGLVVLSTASFLRLKITSMPQPRHDPTLHHSFRGLPGASS